MKSCGKCPIMTSNTSKSYKTKAESFEQAKIGLTSNTQIHHVKRSVKKKNTHLFYFVNKDTNTF